MLRMPPKSAGRRWAAALALSVWAVASAQEPRRATGDVPVTSAVLRIERRVIPGLVLHVENLRDEQLQTWVIGIGGSTRVTDFSRPERSYARGDGPIQWREVRAMRLDPSRLPPSSPDAAVKLVVFEDGWIEGDKEYVDAWVRVREWRVEDASYWLDVLSQASGKTDADAKAILRSAVTRRRQELAERAAPQIRAPLDSFGENSVMSNLASLANETTPRPDGWLARMLVYHRDQMTSFRRAMLRPLFHAPRAPGQAEGSRVGSVAVRVVNEPVTSVFATIENLRDVPIQAYEFFVYDSPTQVGPSTGHGSDNATGDGPERIQPREVRSISLGERAVTPTGRLTFVLYDDLTFEGSIERRDRLFKDRERRAAEYEYWIAALAEARSKPATEIREFLTVKRREWIQQDQDSRQSLLQQMQQLANLADTRPDAVVQSIDNMRARMERVRQALTRHLTR
jgi:hypothetical protein